MRPTDADVSTALEAVSVTRWLWRLKADRGERDEIVAEAHAAYARARRVLQELLQREAESSEDERHASTTRLHEPAPLNGTEAAFASTDAVYASTEADAI